MLNQVVLALVVLVSVTSPLKCHMVFIGNLSVPDNSPLTECGLGTLSCVKVVDFDRGTYTKQCQPMNCSMNGIPNSVANCQKSTIFGISGESCCCYGDGCNSAPTSGIIPVIGAVILASAYFLR